MLFTLSSKIASVACLALATSQLVLSMPTYDLNARADVSGMGLEARAGSSSSSSEFIGYTGTDAAQAALYAKGQFVKTSSSGAGTVMGEGIYLTDTLAEAAGYAQQAAAKSRSQAYVCKFYITKTFWRGNVPKVWFNAAVRNAAMYDQEAAQLGVHGPYVRMSQLTQTANQLILPGVSLQGLVAVCQPVASVTAETKSCDYISMARKWNVRGTVPAPRRGVTCTIQ